MSSTSVSGIPSDASILPAVSVQPVSVQPEVLPEEVRRKVLFQPGSFRDRGARVFVHNEQICRAMTSELLDEWELLRSTSFWNSASEQHQIIPTSRAIELDELVTPAGFAGVLRHERIGFVSWPWEWSFSMLRDAALLQLNLTLSALQENWILKDATPLNFQFRGARPVLIDTPSITRWQEGQAWDGYRQFCQSFLFPLMLQAWKGADFHPWLRGNADGISPGQFAKLLSLRDLFRRGAMSHVWLHSMLQETSSGISSKSAEASVRFDRRMIERNVRGLQRIVEGLKWTPRRSVWSEYNEEAPHVAMDTAQKEQLIRGVCQTIHPKVVWDFGCNQGRYSQVASESADVIAMDSDHLTIDQLYKSLQHHNRERITPLVYNVADPSPAIGWRHSERETLETRSKPQLILCLALLHHLVIGNNLLLSDVVDWLAERQCHVVIEWVDRSDPLVQHLLRHRKDVFTDYGETQFRAAIARHFQIVREIPLTSGHRNLFHLRPLGS